MGYADVAGVDMDPEQVRLARLLKLPATQGDALAAVADSARSFDGIASVDFLEHLPRDHALRFISDCRARLRPGGIFIVRTPCADGPFGSRDVWNDLTHKWAATSTLLRTILVMSGFERVQVLDERPQPYNILNRIRLLGFYPARALASLLLVALGITPPAVWSSSMWAVGYAPPDPSAR